MPDRRIQHIKRFSLILTAFVLLIAASCNITKHIPDGKALLRKNTIILKSDKVINNRGEIKDNLNKLIVQKTNTYSSGFIPFKLWLYNRRYSKYSIKADSSLPKSVERPILFDTSYIARSVQNMKSYMFNQGYFYAQVNDTFIIRDKKAYVTYHVNAGVNYLINKVSYDADDSNVTAILKDDADESGLKKNKEFTYGMLEEERGRITALLRDYGYYRFSQENVTFKLDTVNKTYFKDVESPFENAINFIAQQKSNKKPTVDISVIIRPTDDPAVYVKYGIARVRVYPDFQAQSDYRDSTMIKKVRDSVLFKYHKYYVNAGVLADHIYLNPGQIYSQDDYDKTIVKLNELGIFQYIRINFREDTANHNMLDCNILLNRTKKHDFSTNYEISSGSTYTLGNSLSFNYRDRNFAKGANLLTIGVNGGVELQYNDNYGTGFFNHFYVLTNYYGLNASLDFPKFIAPLPNSIFDNGNLPHTILGGGTNVIDRLDYFTLINTSANFTYSWRATPTQTWTLSPAFINIIRVPYESDSFKQALSNNDYLKNSYKQNFIEGENITYTYNDIDKKHGANYSFLKLGIEEAGGLLGLINDVGASLNDLYSIKYAQYTKLDFDARHYFTFPHSVAAFRFYGGVGVPYGQSDALPYIKQYYVGGPYSLRGWRIRTLGPGSSVPANTVDINTIDRTGDIKLEMNGEYRFPIAPLFAGAIKMNGALFADAGNIWLEKKDTSFVGGEFRLSTLGQDIAVDVGAGLRFDVASFLTLRLDVAMPVKKPYIHTESGWVWDQIAFDDPSWRANNIIFNISIGYPF